MVCLAGRQEWLPVGTWPCSMTCRPTGAGACPLLSKNSKTPCRALPLSIASELCKRGVQVRSAPEELMCNSALQTRNARESCDCNWGVQLRRAPRSCNQSRVVLSVAHVACSPELLCSGYDSDCKQGMRCNDEPLCPSPCKQQGSNWPSCGSPSPPSECMPKESKPACVVSMIQSVFTAYLLRI